MDIPSLILLLQNKVTILSNAKGLAFSSGDLDRMNAIERDLLGTQNTLSQLQLLLAATQAANASSLDLSSVVTAGVQAAQSAMSIPENPTAVLSQYDISTYAADPLYISKITDMLQSMPTIDSPTAADSYVDSQVVGSPITGAMIIDAATRYAVDTRLMMAIMELDSRFGTAGVGAQTFNPGNVGNTGASTQTYASWSDGVAAVAYWLSQHRASGPVPVTTAPVDPVLPALPTDNTTATTTPQTATSTSPMLNTQNDHATTTAPIINNANNTASTTAATSTPAVPPPPIPVVTATTTPAVATSTAATSTDATIPVNHNATTTPDVSSASTTPATASSTPDFNLTGSTTPSTISTSTPDTGISSSTDPVIITDPIPAPDPAASSTAASSTVSLRKSVRKNRG